jgi:transaldolase/glucose-6-phosphate isomerase
MNRIQKLHTAGQSIWLDYIRRNILVTGQFAAEVERGVRGVTSNPTIFANAITGSSDYNSALAQLLEQGATALEAYEILAMEDVRCAAQALKKVYDESGGEDGFVSIEVNPALAHDLEGTVDEAKRLFLAIGMPNVMIKVPATPAGARALEELISIGINVNATLIFNRTHYRMVADAYMAGLEKLSAAGPSIENGSPVERVASVASFFVSRVDSAVDRMLAEKQDKKLAGTIAIANCVASYRLFEELHGEERWHALERVGARRQRMLWASTGTKNPAYSATKYVDQLIGQFTVNTVPPETLEAFVRDGHIDQTLDINAKTAFENLRQLTAIGIDIEAVTGQLQVDGIKAFQDSFDKLLAGIEQKYSDISRGFSSFVARAGSHSKYIREKLQQMTEIDVMSRIWKKDHTLWKPKPDEISNRLGWLHSPEVVRAELNDIREFVASVRADGIETVLLLGMGGSSLAPEVFQMVFNSKPDHPDVQVLDSTHPDAVRETDAGLNYDSTLFLVSTKSGGTVETLSLMNYFYTRALEKMGSVAGTKHFAAITDPGSGLEAMARELKFRKIFLNDPNIGGRFSALSLFGMVPAALIGVDVELLLERAAMMACNSHGCNCPGRADNSAATLGTLIGGLPAKDIDKLTMIFSPELSPFGAWVEQLIAESTGKEGKGVLPVDGEAVGAPESYGTDRLFVYTRTREDHILDKDVQKLEDAGYPVVRILLHDLYDIGGEFFRWEMATAVAGYHMGINPFDQPNVESAKIQARAMLAEFSKQGKLPSPKGGFTENDITCYSDSEADNLVDALSEFFAGHQAGDYLSIQAYLAPHADTDLALEDLHDEIHSRLNLTTTTGYGPRFLHSTGQLHKGDGGNGRFLQFTDKPVNTCPIPDQAGKSDSTVGFETLVAAQSLGDRQALLDNNRRVLRLELGDDAVHKIRHVLHLIKRMK